MNIVHLKYAVEVERTGSITRRRRISIWGSRI